ncbi:hypothetical protein BOX15_Mlig024770g2 [Macrostomum lignano]|uniref:Transporter n=1 Tax=Macrostomum lignano TaxID=282301 RepID=A0A267F8N6_9PLAT|nr:hypothetical protein BOX15_Mlig024770g2 [Macrostomum lignano]
MSKVQEFQGGSGLDMQPMGSTNMEGMPGEEGGDENKERGNWTGRFDFILSAIGFAVGLGNVWRFPYLCYSNGGGAFLIPYVIMLAVAGLPLFYFELSFGQFANLGPVTIWRASPILKGTGWAMVSISALVCIYYNIIIAWSLYYLFASFNSAVPWRNCDNEWNDLRCRDLTQNTTNATHNVAGNLKAGFNPNPMPCNATITVNCTKYQTPSEQYFDRVVLGYTSYTGVDRKMTEFIGVPQWHVTLCLLLAWILVYVCLVKGIKSSGKVVYFTATFPYVVLIILLVRGATLEGALDGIIFYLKPDFYRLADSKVWSDAAVQIFYSLGVAFGGLMTMASYNRFHNNCYRDALVVAVINCGTSVFAGFVIFSVVGFMAKKTGLAVADVATQGPGLAFIAYPEGLAAMPVAPLWSILFFIMILTLGLDSQFAMMETVLTALADEWPWLKKTFKREALFKMVVCVILFLLGIPICCPGGMYLFTLLNNYSAYYNLFLVSFAELLGVCYVYGIKKFVRDIKMMLGFYPGPYWIGCWMFVTPVMMGFILIFGLTQYGRSSYADEPFTDWGEALAWLMMISTAMFIPGFAIYESCIRGAKEAMQAAAAEAPEWGPAVQKYWPDSRRYQEKLDRLIADREARENAAGLDNGDGSRIDGVDNSGFN